jgi:hypothetical protein
MTRPDLPRIGSARGAGKLGVEAMRNHDRRALQQPLAANAND